jgi:hypothetical protein
MTKAKRIGHGDWAINLKRGSIIRAKKSGMLRVVRRVIRGGPKSTRISVVLSIQRCSWTQACYTVYNSNDLRQFFEPTNMRVKEDSPILTSDLARKIESDYAANDKKYRKLTCCDVVGVVS